MAEDDLHVPAGAVGHGTPPSPGHLRMRGASAVAGLRFDCNQIGSIMSEIAACGTAVTVGPVVAMTPGTIPEPHVSRGLHG